MESYCFVISFQTNFMATILPPAVGKSKTNLHTIKIDMTPMVDLGFLLITFFLFTTVLSEPSVTKLSMPKKGGEEMLIDKRLLLTALLDKDIIYVYEGLWPAAQTVHQLKQTNYDLSNGFGAFVRQKQAALDMVGKKEKLMVAIKPLPTSSYQNVISALDEMLINNVSRYGIMELSKEEKKHFHLP